MTAVFPDVEAAGIAVLNTGYTADGITIPVATGIPNPRPDEFITVVRAGGGQQTPVTEAPLLILSAYAVTEMRAAYLLNLARAYLQAVNGTLFGYSEPGGPINFPDPTVPAARYRVTVQLRNRLT